MSAYSFLLFILWSALSWGTTQKVDGIYTYTSLNNVKINCQNSAIHKIRLTSGKPHNCSGQIKIKSASIQYPSGLSQEFDYTSDGEESTLTSTELPLLPGTKCITKLSAQLHVANENSKDCLSQHKVQIVLLQ